MSRYIDAEELKKRWYESHGITEDDSGAFFVGYSELPRFIDSQPTADVRENVRGEWIVKKDIINCSVCKRCSWSKSYEDLVRSFNFCPNCGADMRGDKA